MWFRPLVHESRQLEWLPNLTYIQGQLQPISCFVCWTSRFLPSGSTQFILPPYLVQQDQGRGANRYKILSNYHWNSHISTCFDMTAPLTSVFYRIQNVDFSSYLELTDYSTNLALRRIFKADNLRQQVSVWPARVWVCIAESFTNFSFSGSSLMLDPGHTTLKMPINPLCILVL